MGERIWKAEDGLEFNNKPAMDKHDARCALVSLFASCMLNVISSARAQIEQCGDLNQRDEDVKEAHNG